MERTRRFGSRLLFVLLFLFTAVIGLRPAYALTVSGLSVSLDCAGFTYTSFTFVVDRDNTGASAEAYDITVTDGAGTVLHRISNNGLALGPYTEGGATATYNQGIAPAYNPLTYTWISRAGNGLPAQVAYTTTGNCAALPSYNPGGGSSSSSPTDVEPQFDPGDDRLNRANKDRAAPVAIFCTQWGIEVRIIDYATSIGIDPPAITALYDDIDARGIPDEVPALLGEGGGVTLHRLSTGEFAVHALYPNEYKWYIFVWDQCPVPTNQYHVSV